MTNVALSLKDEFELLSEEQQLAILDGLDPEVLEQMAKGAWWWQQRPEQVPPEGDWTVHLFLGGRGTGKTRSGAEWMVERTLEHPYDSSGFPAERLVMAYSLNDARMVCIEGSSGILRALETRGFEQITDHRHRANPENKYHYVRAPKPHIIILETGAKIFFTGADVDSARGFNLADVWADEIIKWTDPDRVWREGVLPALRADLPGDKPRAFFTTTPKPIELLQKWLHNIAQGKTYYSFARGSTFDNASNLSEDFIKEIVAEYEGTRLGRQELYGEMLEGLEGVLFTYSSIQTNRVTIGPERVGHRTVGVDPGLTGAENADEMGVVVVCRDNRDHMYVIADETKRLASRDAAIHAWRIFDQYQCDTLVYEENLGKAWMKQVFTDAFVELQKAGVFSKDIMTPPLVPVFSTQGKMLRAEPVAMRYQQGRVHHIGEFEDLEKQMLGFDPNKSKNSPDRLDALVHACRHLMSGEKKASRLITPVGRRIPSLSREW